MKTCTQKLIYTIAEKKISNIIDCHLKKAYPILIIFVGFFLSQLAISDRSIFHLT